MCPRIGMGKGCCYTSVGFHLFILLVSSCSARAPSQMYYFHLLLVAGRDLATIPRTWWILRDQTHDRVISDSHHMVSHNQLLWLYQDPGSTPRDVFCFFCFWFFCFLFICFSKMHIVLPLQMAWCSFRIPGPCVMILSLEVVTLSIQYFLSDHWWL